MKKAQRKDFFVEIRKSLNRYLSILFIVALGVAFFSGVRSAEPDMRLSADAVADAANFMDIRVLSTMGLTEEDLDAIRQITGITAAEGEYSMDAIWVHDEKQLVLHVMSLPGEINQVTVKEGRLPQKPGECFVDENLLLVTECELGDTITLSSGTEDALSDTLTEDTYTVVGIGSSPYYLNFDRGSATIGNGDIRGFLMVPEENFALEAYTQIYAAADGLDQYVTAGEKYQDGADELTEAIEAIAGERCEIRLAGIKADAMEEISEAEDELAGKEKEAEDELADARVQIEDGEKELQDGRDEIEENEKKLQDGKDEIASQEKKLQDGWEELAASEKTLADNRTLLEEKRAEIQAASEKLQAARTEYETGKDQTDQGRKELDAARAELNAQEESLSAGWSGYESGMAEAGKAQEMLDSQREQLEVLRQGLEAAGINPEENEQYVQARDAVAAGQAELDGKLLYLSQVKEELDGYQMQYDQGRQTLNEKENELARAEDSLAAAEAELASGEEQISSGNAELQKGQAALEEGERQLESGRRKLEEGEAALEEAKQELADGEEQLLRAKQKLADGEAELEEAKAEYEEGKAEAEEKIADARTEIEDVKKEIEKLKMPEWYVLDRQSVQSYVEFDNDASRIGALGRVFPVIFFLVAALVSLTTMTRMVEEKRTEIGTMKALGYSTLSIASKYIFYALSASLIGSVIGFLIGEKLLPWVIIVSYKILYVNLSIIRIPYNWGYALAASAIAVLCTVGATLAACYKETLAQPSQLMRPAAPLKGKKILLERLPFVWKRLNFSQKSTLRNLLRYKKRLFMTVFGIGGCMSLLIVGFGLRDSIYAVSDIQYGELWRYDVSVSMESGSSEAERSEFYGGIDADEDVKESLGTYTAAMDGEANGVTKLVNLVVPDSVEKSEDFFILRDRKSRASYTLDDEGAVISEKLAKLLGVKEGDSFDLKESETSRVSVKVSHITENYVYNYVYMSPALYEKLYGEAAENNTEYLKLLEKGEEKEQALSERLLKYEAVSGVTLVSSMNQSILDMLESLDMVVWVLIISAGLLAFVVLYNLNNINITERKRELATIKLLGFYDMELAAYVYRENVLLTLIGILAGIFMGSLLHRFVIVTVEVDLIMFGRSVHFISYLWGIALTLLFAVFVNVTMFYKLRRIDMVESLKSIE